MIYKTLQKFYHNRYGRFAILLVAALLIVILLPRKCSHRQVPQPKMSLTGDTIKVTVLMDNVINTGSPAFSFAHSMLKAFNKQSMSYAQMSAMSYSESRWQDLEDGTTDVIVFNWNDSIPDAYIDNVITSFPIFGDIVCATTFNNEKIIDAVNFWIIRYRQTEEYKALYTKYRTKKKKHYAISAPITRYAISPYDETIKKYSKKIGWDWRLVAALIHQESKFNNRVVSRGGAVGLMQVKPSTARTLGVHNVYDPIENIKAGTKLLYRMEKRYKKKGAEETDMIMLALAAYNMGEGRLEQCMKVAENEGKNPLKWEEIATVIPLMKGDGYSEGDVNVPPFNGKTAIRHVDAVLKQYQFYRETVVE